MSLQSPGVANTFANNFAILWRRWLTASNTPAGRAVQRQVMIRNAVVTCTSFMSPPKVVFKNQVGLFGSFYWTSWTLKVGRNHTENDAITYDDFVELCGTVYHETRHAEQFYRVAQGLCAGGLDFPDMSGARIIQESAALPGGRGVKSKIAAFEGRTMQQDQTRVQLVARWLSAPLDKVQHADGNRNGFNTFLALPKPAWFKRATIRLEVEDWMRMTYKTTLGEMDNFAQGPGPYKMYRNLPEEHDAHEIESIVTDPLKTAIGVSFDMHKGKPRNDATFGP